MAGFMKNAMSYLGMSDVADDDDFAVEETPAPAAEGTFDSDHSVTPMPAAAPASQQSTSSRTTPFPGKMSRITTIHPKTYEDAQNLTGVAEAVAYRIVDFSAGVVFGVHGSMERVTPRVFLLSPAQVNIKVEEASSADSARSLFAS